MVPAERYRNGTHPASYGTYCPVRTHSNVRYAGLARTLLRARCTSTYHQVPSVGRVHRSLRTRCTVGYTAHCVRCVLGTILTVLVLTVQVPSVLTNFRALRTKRKLNGESMIRRWCECRSASISSSNHAVTSFHGK